MIIRILEERPRPNPVGNRCQPGENSSLERCFDLWKIDAKSVLDRFEKLDSPVEPSISPKNLTFPIIKR
jgi:hypothetical protein